MSGGGVGCVVMVPLSCGVQRNWFALYNSIDTAAVAAVMLWSTHYQQQQLIASLG